ncbi:MAG: inositol monophosphatase [Geminicoccaceae bacterium]|nr:inositol monophosphatase [Geminicoccaceae bacterium]
MSNGESALRLAAAEAVAREAGALALRYFRDRDRLVVEKKGAQDLVSEADRAVETAIRGRIGELFPDDGFIGEEHAPKPAAAGCGDWVVDPIDGTWCFLNGIGSWCVSIAYAREGTIETGVVYDPNAEELFAARRGNGATLNGRRITVADAHSFTDGTLSIGFSPRRGPEHVVRIIDRLLAQGGIHHRHGSGALGLAWTAAGRLIGYIEPHMNAWDCLAGLLLIEEAGGFTGDFLADDGLHRGNPVCAGPRGLEEAMRALVQP